MPKENKEAVQETATAEVAEDKKKKEPEYEVDNKGERLFPCRLPLIPGAEKQEALFVRVNQETRVVPRGKTVMLPKRFIEVIQHSEDAMLQAEEYRAANMKE